MNLNEPPCRLIILLSLYNYHQNFLTGAQSPLFHHISFALATIAGHLTHEDFREGIPEDRLADAEVVDRANW